MIKYLFLIIIFATLSVNVLAIETEIKESYQPGETIIAEIKGNILGPITKENVEFKRGHVMVSSFEYDVKRLGEKYFLWAVSPSDFGLKNNYTLVIKDILTDSTGILEKITFQRNFSVEGNLTEYNVKPGLISTKEDFEIQVYLYGNNDKKINLDFPNKREISLKPEKNTIRFSIDNFSISGLTNITIGKYLIPVYIIKNDSWKKADSEKTLKFIPDKIEGIELISEKPRAYSFTIANNAGKKIENIILQYDKNIFSISSNQKFNLEKDEKKHFNFSIKDGKDNVNELIYLKYENVSFELPVKIEFTKNASEILRRSNLSKSNYKCEELGGKICSEKEACSEQYKESADGKCCLEKCIKIKENSKAWIGYLIAGIVLLSLIYLYMKYKGTEKNKDFIDKNIEEKNVP